MLLSLPLQIVFRGDVVFRLLILECQNPRKGNGPCVPKKQQGKLACLW
jgi:hypothetical protein